MTQPLRVGLAGLGTVGGGVNNQAGNRPSAHSRAAALDFSGVRLRDGRRIMAFVSDMR